MLTRRALELSRVCTRTVFGLLALMLLVEAFVDFHVWCSKLFFKIVASRALFATHLSLSLPC